MDSYGAEGRSLYIGNLVADTPFPIFGATDLIENALLLSIVLGYPSLPPALIAVTSIITQVKRATYYVSVLALILSMLSVTVKQVKHQPSSQV